MGNVIDYVGTLWTASNGQRSIDLDGLSPGAISQTFDTVLGQKYEVLFDLSGNPDYQSQKKVTVTAANDSSDYLFDSSGHNHTNMGWVTKTFIFTATKNSSTITFKSNQISSGYGPVIDNVRIKQIKQSLTITSFTATPKSGNPPLTVNFSVTADDSDGSISAYQWDFIGDGRIDDTTTTSKVSHTYNDLGTFKPNVTIVDNNGTKTKSSSIPITVQYGPDLVGELRSYNFNNETNTIQIDFKVTNAGDIPARQFPVTFNLSNNGTKVVSIFKNLTVDGLAAGESKALKVDYTFDASIYGQYS